MQGQPRSLGRIPRPCEEWRCRPGQGVGRHSPKALAAAQARALLHEGDALVGFPGNTVSAISNTAVNQVGGYAATISSSGTASLSHVWGAPSGGAGAILRTEMTELLSLQRRADAESGPDLEPPALDPTRPLRIQVTGLDA